MNRGGEGWKHVSADLAPRHLVVIHFHPNCVCATKLGSFIHFSSYGNIMSSFRPTFLTRSTVNCREDRQLQNAFPG